jgi:hypothetical protein
MVGLPCLVIQCAELHVVGWTWAVFTSVYLESCTRPMAIFTMGQKKEQRACSSASTQFLAKRKMAVIPHPPYSPHLALCEYFLFPKMKLIPLRRSRPNRRECLTLWQKRTFRKRSKNGGDSGTGVYMRVGTTSKVMAADRPYGEFMISTASVQNILDNTT